MATMTHRGNDKAGRDVWLFRAYGAKAETFKGSEREAKKALARYEVKVQNREMPAPSQATVGELLEEWFDKKAWKSLGSKRQAREELDRYLLPHLGHVRCSRFDEKPVEALYAGLLDGSLTKRGKPLAPRSLVRLHATLRSACNWAVRRRKLNFNPTLRVDVPAIPPTTVRAPEPEDVVAILEEASVTQTRGRVLVDDPVFATFVRIAAATGRRREDVVALQVRDLKVIERALVFDKRAVSPGKGQPVAIEELDKNGRTARIRLDQKTYDMVAARIAALEDTASACGVRLPRDAFLFSPDPLGKDPWRPEYATSRFGAVTRRLGLKGATLHTLRHHAITSLLEAGIDIETVGRIVGDDAVTILKVYSHYRRTNDDRAANVMAARLEGVEPERRLVAVG